MFRIAWAALLAAVVASLISGGNHLAVLICTAGFFGWAVLSGRTALKCPNCGKRQTRLRRQSAARAAIACITAVWLSQGDRGSDARKCPN